MTKSTSTANKIADSIGATIPAARVYAKRATTSTKSFLARVAESYKRHEQLRLTTK
jgi:hypothetical protein